MQTQAAQYTLCTQKTKPWPTKLQSDHMQKQKTHFQRDVQETSWCEHKAHLDADCAADIKCYIHKEFQTINDCAFTLYLVCHNAARCGSSSSFQVEYLYHDYLWGGYLGFWSGYEGFWWGWSWIFNHTTSSQPLQEDEKDASASCNADMAETDGRWQLGRQGGWEDLPVGWLDWWGIWQVRTIDLEGIWSSE